MQLRTEILKEHSRAQSLKIAAWIGNDPARFDALLQLFLHDEYRVVQRSAWILSLVAEKQPSLVTPHLPVMIRRLDDAGLPVAVKRNVLRVMQFLPLPPALHGRIMHHCFELLANPQETVAVRCFSMVILSRLAREYPDIRNEVRLIIEDQLEHSPTAGFRSRAKKTLKEIG